jgi:hypothetical protein
MFSYSIGTRNHGEYAAAAEVSYDRCTVKTKHLQRAGFVGDCMVKEHQATEEDHEEYHFQFL